MTKQPSLFDGIEADPPAPDAPPDQAARDFAVRPEHNVVLEASAGTGKTRVLVDRYVALIAQGVHPRHILAITFTRKAAAEMRERILSTLRARAGTGALTPDRWRELRESVADIQISTIDAFCFGLLREFPLEARVDPAFDIADETEMARFANEALDLTLRAVRGLMHDEAVRLLLARVKAPVLRGVIAGLLDRRHVAFPAVQAFVDRAGPPRPAVDVGAAFVAAVGAAVSGHTAALLDDGPRTAPEFRWFAADLRTLDAFPSDRPVRVQRLRRQIERYFLTDNGRKVRQKLMNGLAGFPSPDARKRHQSAVAAASPAILEATRMLDREVTRLLAHGLRRVLAIAIERYERLLHEQSLMDFAAMLDAAIALLQRQEEFARSRLKLQSRYRHLLVDEFQDTSRRQWRLIELLIDAWGEGEGVADEPTSIFIVGDRKQSIYRFRHAEVMLLDEAARKIDGLRPGRTVRQSISTSFRAVPELLAFVNALASGMEGDRELAEHFSYRETDRFPVPAVERGARRDGRPVLGLVVEPTMATCAAAVATEIRRLLDSGAVRGEAGARPVRPDDIAILFRARAGHQFFEEELERRDIRTYVYKGLGFFDAPEVQDAQALLRFLARPDSDLRAAEFLRSRIVRLSDQALTRLAPAFAAAVGDPAFDLTGRGLDELDLALLQCARASIARWLPLAAHLPPGEVVDLVLRDAAYAFEMRGRRFEQALENIKKVRSLVRRVENRGYATLGRLAAYLETLRAGDESNAIVNAKGAVNLMTIHAAKGLEFPIVFVVNLQAPGRGQTGAVSVIERGPDDEPDVAFGSSAATKLEDRRETEELRRVFYVAVTRAKDRLYLSAVIDGPRGLKRGGRSLAGLMPGTLADVFTQAAQAGGGEVEWVTPAGTFAFDVCRPSNAVAAAPAAVAEDEPPPMADLVPLTVPGPRLVAAVPATAIVEDKPARSRRRKDRPGRDERLLGTIVHRLFQRQVDAALDDARLAAEAERLMGPDERVDLDDVTGLAAEAAALYRAFRKRPDVTAVLGRGRCFYEVPFSYVPPDRPEERIRGVVDCLVLDDAGAAVVEFKTGDPRPEHEAQARIYADAMRAVLGGNSVALHVLYA